MLKNASLALQLVPLVKEVVGDLFAVNQQVVAPKKVSDRVELTDYHIRVIHAEYAGFQLHNRVNRPKQTQKELADLLNQKFGFNKSVRFYSKIWNKRDT